MKTTPTLHAYDTGEELRDATPAELAASVAGPAPLVSWRELQVWGLDGALLDDADTRDALAEYRRTGAMTAWLADPADYGTDGEPLSGEGPELHEAGPAREEIDWAGFDAAVSVGEGEL